MLQLTLVALAGPIGAAEGQPTARMVHATLMQLIWQYGLHRECKYTQVIIVVSYTLTSTPCFKNFTMAQFKIQHYAFEMSKGDQIIYAKAEVRCPMKKLEIICTYVS